MADLSIIKLVLEVLIKEVYIIKVEVREKLFLWHFQDSSMMEIPHFQLDIQIKILMRLSGMASTTANSSYGKYAASDFNNRTAWPIYLRN